MHTCTPRHKPPQAERESKVRSQKISIRLVYVIVMCAKNCRTNNDNNNNNYQHYIVNRARTIPKQSAKIDVREGLQKPGDLPSAIFTISKNVLGRNVTDMVVKPLVSLGSGKVVSQDNRPCTTPDGTQGNCEDLSNCPQLLLNLGHLRQSICFKHLFVPGVCCPKKTPEQ